MTFPAPYDLWFPDAAFDGTYGFTLETLRAVAPVPPAPDFPDRWLD